jgi:drug/metabolite transporter (DMT)-like permease
VYSSLRFGKVGVVAPITSAQGAAAAVIAVTAGEQIATGAGVALGAIVVGVVLSSMARTNEAGSDRREGLAIGLAIGAALFFGLGLYAMGRLAEDIPDRVDHLPVQDDRRGPRHDPARGHRASADDARRRAAGRGLGAARGGGLVAFTIGARHGIAVAAVLGSQFAAIAAVAAFVLFRERLARVQVVGVAVIAVGVAVLTALQA